MNEVMDARSPAMGCMLVGSEPTLPCHNRDKVRYWVPTTTHGKATRVHYQMSW